MKTLTHTLPLTLALGGLVALLVLVLPFDAAGRSSWLAGALAASLLGALTLSLKVLWSGVAVASLQSLLLAQMAGFFLRLVAVVAGAIFIKQAELSPPAFVISFLIVSLAQQVLETRSLLTERKLPKSPEVTS